MYLTPTTMQSPELSKNQNGVRPILNYIKLNYEPLINQKICDCCVLFPADKFISPRGRSVPFAEAWGVIFSVSLRES